MIKSLPLGIVLILCCLAIGTLFVLDTTPPTANLPSPKPPLSSAPVQEQPSATISSSSTEPDKTTEVKPETPVVTNQNTTAQAKPTITELIPIMKNSDLTIAESNSTTLKPVTTNKLAWGVFTGSNPTTIAEFESRVEVNPDYLAYFIHWGNGGGKLPTWLRQSVADRGRTLVIFWEASDYRIGGTDQPEYSYKKILEGNWDTYFEDFNTQLADYGGPIILIPFSELNGNWTPWSGTKNGNTPAEAVAAFRYVHRFFNETNNVSLGWAVNAASVPNTPENQIQNYYPGDAYVDYIGVDGFNMGNPWLSFDSIFGSALQTLSLYKKPTFIFSFASAESSQKATWLDDALNVQLPQYPFVTGWIYFNQNKERNWLLWSDEETFSVFEKYITQ